MTRVNFQTIIFTDIYSIVLLADLNSDFREVSGELVDREISEHDLINIGRIVTCLSHLNDKALQHEVIVLAQAVNKETLGMYNLPTNQRNNRPRTNFAKPASRGITHLPKTQAVT
jgi:hypothetical protein